MSSEIQISIIDDDEQSRSALAGLLQAMGFTTETYSSAVEFLASPNLRDSSCLIVDVHMPRMTGTELHSRLVGSGYNIPNDFLITAYPDDSARTRALDQGVVGYLTKPIDEKVLVGCVNRLYSARNQMKSLISKRSAAAQETFPLARKSFLFERIPVNVKSVKFPQARRFAIQELDPAHPFHALITIEVGTTSRSG